MDKVILVDERDHPIGIMDKIEAHEKGLLHRAISVFIFDSEGRLLLQRRAFGKYHSEGLWTNTCCSHPFPEESSIDAAKRRLMEEMGMTCELEERFSFIYQAELDNGLSEHELDHVFVGHSDDTPHLNPEEAMSFKWMAPEDLKADIQNSPEQYTIWFRIIIEQHFDEIFGTVTHESL